MSNVLQPRHHDDGYLLLGLVVVCFLLILALGVAAPRVAKQLERDREIESEHRAHEYVRAIQLYYRKNQRFPSSVDQLLGTGTTGISAATNVKYLRQRYKDPLTRDDYRLILVGTAKTEVKGFFGEPLAGVPSGNLGSVSGLQSGGNAASAFGGSTPGSPVSSSGSFGGNSFGISPNPTSSQTSGSAGVTPAGTASSATSLASSSSGTALGPGSGSSPIEGGTLSGTSATTFQGSKGAFLGVGSNAKGHGLVEWNGSENIEEWEFLYDPRVELLKAKVNFFGGSSAPGGSGSFGGSVGAGSTSIFGPSTGTGATGTTNSTAPPANTTSPGGISPNTP